jgi:hypothetical protein
MTVKSTREGLVGQTTSSGYVIDKHVPFVALPSVNACHPVHAVRVTNPANGKGCIALVLDVGPFNEHDDAYVFGGSRPLAESQATGGDGVTSNGAGIDLGEYVWAALGMTGNNDVEWEFVS